MTRKLGNRAIRLALSGLLLAALAAAPGFAEIAQAQSAMEYRPDRVRNIMLSIHGYTREDLEGASTNVDQILMSLADDAQEKIFVRRQAIKGLRLYPTTGVLTFIEQKSVSAPANLKRLYLSSAAGFVQGFPARVQVLAQTHLNDDSVNVRFSALKLSGALAQTPQVRTILQNRLSVEPDQNLRTAIQKQLNPN